MKRITSLTIGVFPIMSEHETLLTPSDPKLTTNWVALQPGNYKPRESLAQFKKALLNFNQAYKPDIPMGVGDEHSCVYIYPQGTIEIIGKVYCWNKLVKPGIYSAFEKLRFLSNDEEVTHRDNNQYSHHTPYNVTSKDTSHPEKRKYIKFTRTQGEELIQYRYVSYLDQVNAGNEKANYPIPIIDGELTLYPDGTFKTKGIVVASKNSRYVDEYGYAGNLEIDSLQQSYFDEITKDDINPYNVYTVISENEDGSVTYGPIEANKNVKRKHWLTLPKQLFPVNDGKVQVSEHGIVYLEGLVLTSYGHRIKKTTFKLREFYENINNPEWVALDEIYNPTMLSPFDGSNWVLDIANGKKDVYRYYYDERSFTVHEDDYGLTLTFKAMPRYDTFVNDLGNKDYGVKLLEYIFNSLQNANRSPLRLNTTLPLYTVTYPWRFDDVIMMGNKYRYPSYRLDDNGEPAYFQLLDHSIPRWDFKDLVLHRFDKNSLDIYTPAFNKEKINFVNQDKIDTSLTLAETNEQKPWFHFAKLNNVTPVEFDTEVDNNHNRFVPIGGQILNERKVEVFSRQDKRTLSFEHSGVLFFKGEDGKTYIEVKGQVVWNRGDRYYLLNEGTVEYNIVWPDVIQDKDGNYVSLFDVNGYFTDEPIFIGKPGEDGIIKNDLDTIDGVRRQEKGVFTLIDRDITQYLTDYEKRLISNTTGHERIFEYNKETVSIKETFRYWLNVPYTTYHTNIVLNYFSFRTAEIVPSWFPAGVPVLLKSNTSNIIPNNNRYFYYNREQNYLVAYETMDIVSALNNDTAFIAYINKGDIVSRETIKIYHDVNIKGKWYRGNLNNQNNNSSDNRFFGYTSSLYLPDQVIPTPSSYISLPEIAVSDFQWFNPILEDKGGKDRPANMWYISKGNYPITAVENNHFIFYRYFNDTKLISGTAIKEKDYFDIPMPFIKDPKARGYIEIWIDNPFLQFKYAKNKEKKYRSYFRLKLRNSDKLLPITLFQPSIEELDDYTVEITGYAEPFSDIVMTTLDDTPLKHLKCRADSAGKFTIKLTEGGQLVPNKSYKIVETDEYGLTDELLVNVNKHTWKQGEYISPLQLMNHDKYVYPFNVRHQDNLTSTPNLVDSALTINPQNQTYTVHGIMMDTDGYIFPEGTYDIGAKPTLYKSQYLTNNGLTTKVQYRNKGIDVYRIGTTYKATRNDPILLQQAIFKGSVIRNEKWLLPRDWVTRFNQYIETDDFKAKFTVNRLDTIRYLAENFFTWIDENTEVARYQNNLVFNHHICFRPSVGLPYWFTQSAGERLVDGAYNGYLKEGMSPEQLLSRLNYSFDNSEYTGQAPWFIRYSNTDFLKSTSAMIDFMHVKTMPDHSSIVQPLNWQVPAFAIADKTHVYKLNNRAIKTTTLANSDYLLTVYGIRNWDNLVEPDLYHPNEPYIFWQQNYSFTLTQNYDTLAVNDKMKQDVYNNWSTRFPPEMFVFDELSNTQLSQVEYQSDGETVIIKGKVKIGGRYTATGPQTVTSKDEIVFLPVCPEAFAPYDINDRVVLNPDDSITIKGIVYTRKCRDGEYINKPFVDDDDTLLLPFISGIFISHIDDQYTDNRFYCKDGKKEYRTQIEVMSRSRKSMKDNTDDLRIDTDFEYLDENDVVLYNSPMSESYNIVKGSVEYLSSQGAYARYSRLTLGTTKYEAVMTAEERQRIHGRYGTISKVNLIYVLYHQDFAVDRVIIPLTIKEPVTTLTSYQMVEEENDHMYSARRFKLTYKGDNQLVNVARSLSNRFSIAPNKKIFTLPDKSVWSNDDYDTMLDTMVRVPADGIINYPRNPGQSIKFNVYRERNGDDVGVPPSWLKELPDQLIFSVYDNELKQTLYVANDIDYSTFRFIPKVTNVKHQSNTDVVLDIEMEGVPLYYLKDAVSSKNRDFELVLTGYEPGTDNVIVSSRVINSTIRPEVRNDKLILKGIVFNFSNAQQSKVIRPYPTGRTNAYSATEETSASMDILTVEYRLTVLPFYVTKEPATFNRFKEKIGVTEFNLGTVKRDVTVVSLMDVFYRPHHQIGYELYTVRAAFTLDGYTSYFQDKLMIEQKVFIDDETETNMVIRYPINKVEKFIANKPPLKEPLQYYIELTADTIKTVKGENVIIPNPFATDTINPATIVTVSNGNYLRVSKHLRFEYRIVSDTIESKYISQDKLTVIKQVKYPLPNLKASSISVNEDKTLSIQAKWQDNYPWFTKDSQLRIRAVLKNGNTEVRTLPALSLSLSGQSLTTPDFTYDIDESTIDHTDLFGWDWVLLPFKDKVNKLHVNHDDPQYTSVEYYLDVSDDQLNFSKSFRLVTQPVYQRYRLDRVVGKNFQNFNIVGYMYELADLDYYGTPYASNSLQDFTADVIKQSINGVVYPKVLGSKNENNTAKLIFNVDSNHEFYQDETPLPLAVPGLERLKYNPYYRIVDGVDKYYWPPITDSITTTYKLVNTSENVRNRRFDDRQEIVITNTIDYVSIKPSITYNGINPNAGTNNQIGLNFTLNNPMRIFFQMDYRQRPWPIVVSVLRLHADGTEELYWQSGEFTELTAHRETRNQSIVFTNAILTEVKPLKELGIFINPGIREEKNEFNYNLPPNEEIRFIARVSYNIPEEYREQYFDRFTSADITLPASMRYGSKISYQGTWVRDGANNNPISPTGSYNNENIEFTDFYNAKHLIVDLDDENKDYTCFKVTYKHHNGDINNARVTEMIWPLNKPVYTQHGITCYIEPFEESTVNQSIIKPTWKQLRFVYDRESMTGEDWWSPLPSGSIGFNTRKPLRNPVMPYSVITVTSEITTIDDSLTRAYVSSTAGVSKRNILIRTSEPVKPNIYANISFTVKQTPSNIGENGEIFIDLYSNGDRSSIYHPFLKWKLIFDFMDSNDQSLFNYELPLDYLGDKSIHNDLFGYTLTEEIKQVLTFYNYCKAIHNGKNNNSILYLNELTEPLSNIPYIGNWMQAKKFKITAYMVSELDNISPQTREIGQWNLERQMRLTGISFPNEDINHTEFACDPTIFTLHFENVPENWDEAKTPKVEIRYYRDDKNNDILTSKMNVYNAQGRGSITFTVQKNQNQNTMSITYNIGESRTIRYTDGVNGVTVSALWPRYHHFYSEKRFENDLEDGSIFLFTSTTGYWDMYFCEEESGVRKMYSNDHIRYNNTIYPFKFIFQEPLVDVFGDNVRKLAFKQGIINTNNLLESLKPRIKSYFVIEYVPVGGYVRQEEIPFTIDHFEQYEREGGDIGYRYIGTGESDENRIKLENMMEILRVNKNTGKYDKHFYLFDHVYNKYRNNVFSGLTINEGTLSIRMDYRLPQYLDGWRGKWVEDLNRITITSSIEINKLEVMYNDIGTTDKRSLIGPAIFYITYDRCRIGDNHNFIIPDVILEASVGQGVLTTVKTDECERKIINIEKDKNGTYSKVKVKYTYNGNDKIYPSYSDNVILQNMPRNPPINNIPVYNTQSMTINWVARFEKPGTWYYGYLTTSLSYTIPKR